MSPGPTRQILRGLRFRFRRPKVSPRGLDPNREAIHQQMGQKIAQAAAGTLVRVEDETDIRLFPILRQIWMRMGEQIELPALLTNQKRTIFGALEIWTGKVFYRHFQRPRTAEMIAFLEALCIGWAWIALTVSLSNLPAKPEYVSL